MRAFDTESPGCEEYGDGGAGLWLIIGLAGFGEVGWRGGFLSEREGEEEVGTYFEHLDKCYAEV